MYGVAGVCCRSIFLRLGKGNGVHLLIAILLSNMQI